MRRWIRTVAGVGRNGVAEGALAWAATSGVDPCRWSHRALYLWRGLRDGTPCRTASGALRDAEGNFGSIEGFLSGSGSERVAGAAAQGAAERRDCADGCPLDSGWTAVEELCAT